MIQNEKDGHGPKSHDDRQLIKQKEFYSNPHHPPTQWPSQSYNNYTPNSKLLKEQQDFTQSENEDDHLRKEIYTYDAPWTVQAMAWSYRYVQNSQYLLHNIL